MQQTEAIHSTVKMSIGVGGSASATKGEEAVANLATKFTKPMDVTEKSVGKRVGCVAYTTLKALAIPNLARRTKKTNSPSLELSSHMRIEKPATADRVKQTSKIHLELKCDNKQPEMM